MRISAWKPRLKVALAIGLALIAAGSLKGHSRWSASRASLRSLRSSRVAQYAVAPVWLMKGHIPNVLQVDACASKNF